MTEGELVRLTAQELEDAISEVEYFRLPRTTVTICSIKLHDGFVVIGQSACIDPRGFDELRGRKAAFDDAHGKLWNPMGYAKMLRSKGKLPPVEALITTPDLALPVTPGEESRPAQAPPMQGALEGGL